MYQLRPYQEKAVEAGIEIFTQKRDRNGIAVLPTGSGKSLVIASIATQVSGHTLVFQPSKEILEQNVEKTHGFGFHDVGVFSASAGRKDMGKITFATIGSVTNHAELFEHFDNIIMDECHGANAKGGMYEAFFKRMGKRVFGVSASPYRMYASFGVPEARFLHRTRPRIFDDIVHVTQVKELYELGFLCPVQYHKFDGYDQNAIASNSTGMDFDQKALKIYNEKFGLVRKVALSIAEHKPKHVLVFCVFVEEAEHLSAELRSVGITAATVSAKTHPKERERILAEFKAGYIQVVTNVGVLTTGFDFPALDCVILARPTKSLILYYQMVGRGVRTFEGKDHFKLIDMCENVDKFGHIEEFEIVEPKKGLHYLQSNVGIIAGGKPKRPKMPSDVMAFGKHKGEKLSDIPTDYIVWCLENIKQSLLQKVLTAELERRGKGLSTSDSFDSIDERGETGILFSGSID